MKKTNAFRLKKLGGVLFYRLMWTHLTFRAARRDATWRDAARRDRKHTLTLQSKVDF
jgi:hypothetical protein